MEIIDCLKELRLPRQIVELILFRVDLRVVSGQVPEND